MKGVFTLEDIHFLFFEIIAAGDIPGLQGFDGTTEIEVIF